MSASQQGLIADIGATNARFALAGPDGIDREAVLKCADYPGIAEAAETYLKTISDADKPKQASVAIAGPVNGDRFEMTNHPWSFSINETRVRLGLEKFTLMNDFKAIALSVPHMQAEDVRKIGDGVPVAGAPIGVIGPGTGLGVASLFWDGHRYQAVPGEGGHVTMPAKVQREFDVFRTLRYKYRHVSAERVCSGKGLVNIYNALRILDGRDDLDVRTPEEISMAALDGSCDICAEALDLMMGFLGTIASNLAVTLGAHGGIYLGGGIINRLGDYFYQSPFYDQFRAKGRFENYLSDIPVFIIQHPFPAFVGLRADLLQDL